MPNKWINVSWCYEGEQSNVILECTTSLDTSSRTLFVREDVHVTSNVELRNYVPSFGVTQSNVDLRNITSDCF